MKIFLAYTILTLTTIIASAQNPAGRDYDRFYRSFATEINYPANLINGCTATACLFKIMINEQGNIKSMELSDSADSLFRSGFEKNKQHLDTVAFKHYIKANFNYTANNVYTIPIFYSLYRMGCSPATLDFNILKSYYKFMTKDLIGNIVMLNAFEYKIKVQN